MPALLPCGEVRVVAPQRVPAHDDGIGPRALQVHALPRDRACAAAPHVSMLVTARWQQGCRTRDPCRVAGARRNLAVQRHRVFPNGKRLPRGHKVQQRLIDALAGGNHDGGGRTRRCSNLGSHVNLPRVAVRFQCGDARMLPRTQCRARAAPAARRSAAQRPHVRAAAPAGAAGRPPRGPRRSRAARPRWRFHRRTARAPARGSSTLPWTRVGSAHAASCIHAQRRAPVPPAALPLACAAASTSGRVPPWPNCGARGVSAHILFYTKLSRLHDGACLKRLGHGGASRVHEHAACASALAS